MTTHADRILDFVRRFPGRDDDQIANALAIFPRQTVNLNCRRLEERGLLERRRGPDGKIVNHLPGTSPGRGQTKTVNQPADRKAIPLAVTRPALTTEILLEAGFSLAGRWTLDADRRLAVDGKLPSGRGVYSFLMKGRAQYVGLATMGLAKRLYFYARPGATQKTSLRLNALLTDLVSSGAIITIYTAHPPRLTWNNLPVSGDAGLELGLIETYDLPWNKRGVKLA